MQKIGCRLLCFIANADSCLCTLEHGKGQLDFFQNHVNRWWLPCLANICVCWLWCTSQNEHQLSVRYFLAFGTRWSFCFSSFVSYWSSILHCSPHLCGKQSIVSVLLGRICFFQTTLFSQPPSFPLSTPHCYWEGSTAFHWRVYGVRIAASLVFAGWHVAVCVTTHLWYTSEIFQVLHSRAYQDPPTAVIPLQSLTCESWLVTSRYTMQWIIFHLPPHRLLIVAVVTILKSYYLPAVTPQWY